MDEPRNKEKLRVACPIEAQPATFETFSATTSATNNATNGLKALATVVLARNRQRNQGATTPENQRNFYSENSPEKLRSEKQPPKELSKTPYGSIQTSHFSENEALSVTCYTPAGNPITVQARDADHAEWLIRINPKPDKT